MRKLFPLAALVLIGCSSDPGKNPEQVDVSGKVTLAGKAVSDVFLNLQPTGSGTEARLPVKNGEFKGKLTPGRYTYYITEDSKRPAAFQAIPEKYRAGSLDRQINIDEGSLTLTLD
jgi:hypothetical protein